MTDKTPATLDRLWDDIATGHAPIGDLITAGRAARRRKRHTTLAGVAAVAALIVGGGLVAETVLNDHDASIDSHDPPIGVGSSGQRAIDSRRLVGIGRVVIAVPSKWSSNDASCNTPFHNTYFFPYPQDCQLAFRPAVSSVAITGRTFTESRTSSRHLETDGEVGGHEVRASKAVCETTPNGPCRQTFGIPDLDAYFTVTIPQDGSHNATAQIAAIRASLAVLPDHQAVVPFTSSGDETDVTQALEAAGLSVTVNRTTCLPSDVCVSPGVVDITPVVGTVVPTGTTVTVTVLDR